jgi:hypothetical protein
MVAKRVTASRAIHGTIDGNPEITIRHKIFQLKNTFHLLFHNGNSNLSWFQSETFTPQKRQNTM